MRKPIFVGIPIRVLLNGVPTNVWWLAHVRRLSILFFLLLFGCAERVPAQQPVPTIVFSAPAAIALRGALAAGVVVVYCARSVEQQHRTLISHLAAPAVSHERKTLTCPAGYDTLVRTQAPGAPCGFDDRERAVFLARSERLRIIACRGSLAVLVRQAAVNKLRET